MKDRRYDIDWLRVIAIALLLVYHIGIVFQPWGVLIGFIQNDQAVTSLWIPMTMMNIWRIPLLFFVSGMGVSFAIRKRNWKQLLAERSRRILLPFLFGMLFIVPLHLFIWQHYYHQEPVYSPHPGHLWFLGNIFLYVLLLTPVFIFLQRNQENMLNRWMRRLYSHPLGLLLITGFFILEAELTRPEIYEFYALNLHGFLLGLLAFFFGFTFVLNGNTFWKTVLKWRWIFLVLAVSLYLIRYSVFNLKSPYPLMVMESQAWIFSIFGLAAKYLNRPGKLLDYLSQAAYPVYIIHMAVLYLLSSWILPLALPGLIKFGLILLFTFLGCFVLYDLIIRRIGILRPLFGLRPTQGEYRQGKPFWLKKTVLLFPVMAILFINCQPGFSVKYSYRPPVNTGDGLETGSLKNAGIHEGMMDRAVKKIYSGRYREVHSLLIYRENNLVLEEYFPGHRWKWDAPFHHGEIVEWNGKMIHNIMSAGKSITSACIGIAIDRGYIKDVQQPVSDFFPDLRHLFKGGKEKITVEHLLTMTSGLEWKEWSAPYSSAANPAIGIWFQEKDPVSFILGQPLISEPGSRFNYSTGNMILLGEIIHVASGKTIDEFSMEFLFRPLSVDTARWDVKFPDGVDNNNLMITPRAMVKIGVLFLNGGNWKGKQVISSGWVEKSTKPYGNNVGINVPGEPSGRQGYAYGWWTKTYFMGGRKIDMFIASGFGGQHIMVIPSLNAVVVFTGGNYVSRRPPFKILKKYVLPAIL